MYVHVCVRLLIGTQDFFALDNSIKGIYMYMYSRWAISIKWSEFDIRESRLHVRMWFRQTIQSSQQGMYNCIY